MTKTPLQLSQLARIALLVAVADLSTKFAAPWFLQGGSVDLTSWLRLAVVHNDRGAFGLSLGAYTRQLNLALTFAAIALMVPVNRDLARVDRLSPIALGLIVGGALGNLTSMIISSRGVVDFIAISTSDSSAIVLNVADLAAYGGLALLGRTGFLLVNRIRADVRPATIMTTTRTVASRPALSLVRGDREVPLQVFPDGRGRNGVARPAAADRGTGIRPRTAEFPILGEEPRGDSAL